jgi:hypothetical protein
MHNDPKQLRLSMTQIGAILWDKETDSSRVRELALNLSVCSRPLWVLRACSVGAPNSRPRSERDPARDATTRDSFSYSSL